MQRARQGIASQRSKTDVFFLRTVPAKWKSGVIDHDILIPARLTTRRGAEKQLHDLDVLDPHVAPHIELGPIQSGKTRMLSPGASLQL